jgi:sigma-B regulation protein RsbU (phosphoserine phosphatase)
VLEFNPAAQATFGYQRHEVIGRFLADLIIPADMRERHTRGLERYLETGEGALINRRVEVSAVRRDGTSFPVELTITPVVGADPPSFTGYIRDITERRRAQSELLRNRERLMHMVRTLQSSLLPPVLPDVPGLELASVYRPAGDGNDVGGDFYDVFELSETRWALVRYTLRAAAFRNPSDPAAVLAEVHQAIERQRPDTFCTVAYAVVQPHLARAEIVQGGHPAALHVTPAGDVTPVGGRGPLLGLADHWAGHSQTVALSPGDTLVLYSDGVTEARRGDELFGAARLAGVAAERAATASDLVAAIDRQVVDFAGRLGDDMAVLAARLR